MNRTEPFTTYENIKAALNARPLILRASADLRYALDGYGLEDYFLVGFVLVIAGDERDFVDDVLAFNDFAEDGVLAGEPGGGRDGDEELAAVGVGAAVGHGEFAGFVELVRRSRGFILEFITGATHAGACGVAALNHEVGNDAMEDGAVIELAG